MKGSYLSLILLAAFISGCMQSAEQQMINKGTKTPKIVCLKEVANLFFYNDEEGLIFQTYNGNIIKLDTSLNKVVWKYVNTSSAYPSVGSVMSDDLIWFNEWGGSPIIALNQEGEVVLYIQHNIFDYSNIFIKDTDGIITAGINGISKINYLQKEVDWIKECFHSSGKCDPFIEDAGANIILAGLSDSLYVDHDVIMSVKKSNGEENWKYRFKGSAITKIVNNSGKVFVGLKAPSSPEVSYNNANFIVCLDEKTGELVWKETYDFSHSSKLLVNKNNLYFSTRETLYSVNRNNGKLIWSKNLSPFVELLDWHKGIIVVRQTDGIAVIDPEKGEITNEIKALIKGGPWFLENGVFYYTDDCIYELN